MKRRALFGGTFDPPTLGHLIQISELLTLPTEGEDKGAENEEEEHEDGEREKKQDESGDKKVDSKKRFFFDEVIVRVCGDNRVDKHPMCTAAQRHLMLVAALKEYLPTHLDRVILGDGQVDTTEVEGNEWTPTWQAWDQWNKGEVSCATLEANSSAETANLKETAPDTKATAETWVIIGADLIYTVPKWIRGDFLVANVPFFVLPRKGFVVDPVVVEARHVYYALPKYFSETSHSSTQARRLLGMPVNPNSQAQLEQLLCKSVINYIGQNSLYIPHAG